MPATPKPAEPKDGYQAPKTTWQPAPSTCDVEGGQATFRMGQKGAGVADLQQKLCAAGSPVGVVDGKFGKDTQVAVAKFQKQQGLYPSGIVDQKTMAAIEKVGAARPSGSTGGTSGAAGASGATGATGATGAGGSTPAATATTAPPKDEAEMSPNARAAAAYNKVADALESGKIRKGEDPKRDEAIQKMLALDGPALSIGDGPALKEHVLARERFHRAAERAGYTPPSYR
jgi:hypothetical protein